MSRIAICISMGAQLTNAVKVTSMPSGQQNSKFPAPAREPVEKSRDEFARGDVVECNGKLAIVTSNGTRHFGMIKLKAVGRSLSVMASQCKRVVPETTREEKKSKLKNASKDHPVDVYFEHDGETILGKVVSRTSRPGQSSLYNVISDDGKFQKTVDKLGLQKNQPDPFTKVYYKTQAGKRATFEMNSWGEFVLKLSGENLKIVQIDGGIQFGNDDDERSVASVWTCSSSIGPLTPSASFPAKLIWKRQYDGETRTWQKIGSEYIEDIEDFEMPRENLVAKLTRNLRWSRSRSFDI